MKKRSSMNYAIKILENERETIISLLKQGQKERLQDLQELDKALGWLHLLQDHKVDKANRYNFEALPFIEGYGGFTSYRIMIDKETDDTSYWEEYKKPDGSYYLLQLGDFIVKEKPYN